jgi:UDPglucose 6-dehydrogenase
VLPPGANVRYAENAYAAAEGADALLILNDWQDFAELDLDKLYRALRYPIIVDGRNLYDPAAMAARGFTYLSVGRPTVPPVRDAVGSRKANASETR